MTHSAPTHRFNKAILASALALTLCACSESSTENASSTEPQLASQSDAAGSSLVNPANGTAGNLASDSASTQVGNTINDTPGQVAEQNPASIATPGASGVISGGSEFSSDETGVRFRMPNSLEGQLNAQTGAVVFANAQNTVGGFIFGGSAGGVQTAASIAIRKLLPELGLQIETTFVDDFTDTSTTSQFNVVGENGAGLFMNLETRMGSNGNYVGFLGSSSFNNQSELNVLMAEMANSTSFNNPSQPTNEVNLLGAVLQATDNFGGSVGGQGDVSVGDDQSSLEICANGVYRFTSESRFFLGFDSGGSASTSDSITHEGGLLSHVDFVGNQKLAMFSNTQGVFTFTVTPGNGGVFLDQEFYQQTGTSEQQCSG